MKKIFTPVLVISIFLCVFAVVFINVKKQLSIDRSKIPQKVELSKGFQKWITNLKNKGFVIEADEFKLKEENEIYNTRWIKINSTDEPGMQNQLNINIAKVKNTPKVVFSPSGEQFVDYRNITRDGYNPNEVRLYGLKEDKVIDARILDCSVRANCYFDRAYFLDNNVFVISEISRNIDKKDQYAPDCLPSMECTYTFKIHVVDLINNSRLVYESKPFTVVLTDVLPKL
jgi:hypothetical protein